MFDIGDKLLYGGEGVCKITGTESKTIGDKVLNYYVLSAMNGSGSVFYVPQTGKIAEEKLKKLLTAGEIKKLIEKTKVIKLPESDRVRKDLYKDAILKAERENIFSYIKTIDEMEKNLAAIGKKLHKVDEYFVSDARKFLITEFSLLFKIEREEFVPFILGKILPQEK